MTTLKFIPAPHEEFFGPRMNSPWDDIPSYQTSQTATQLVYGNDVLIFNHSRAPFFTLGTSDLHYDLSNVDVTSLTFNDFYNGSFTATGEMDVEKFLKSSLPINYGDTAITLLKHILKGNDYIVGTSLDDYISGYGGNDRIVTGSGADKLYGSSGDDALFGGNGWDSLSGGSGKDSFVFNFGLTANTNYHYDRLRDFSSVDDTIKIDNDFFLKAGALGVLKSTAFHRGSSAHDSNDRIIYTASTGKIYYDADGTGAGEQKLFAILSANTAINYNDFVIID